MSTPADVSTMADVPARIRERLLEGDPEPALQLFPPLSDRDLKEHRESVRARGVRVPVELDAAGRVLDGHHRLQVARELELEAGEVPVTVRDDLQDDEAALEYMLEVNLGRRHLSREGRQHVGRTLRDRGWSLRRIANRVGVSHTTIRRDLDDAGGTNVTPDGGSDSRVRVEGADGKRYPASRSSGSSYDKGGSGGREAAPGHAQGRGPAGASGSQDRSGRRRRRQEENRSRSEDSESGSEPDRDPRIDLLNRTDAVLSKARRLTPEEETGVRDELEALGDRCADLVAEIAGAGDGWVI